MNLCHPVWFQCHCRIEGCNEIKEGKEGKTDRAMSKGQEHRGGKTDRAMTEGQEHREGKTDRAMIEGQEHREGKEGKEDPTMDKGQEHSKDPTRDKGQESKKDNSMDNGKERPRTMEVRSLQQPHRASMGQEHRKAKDTDLQEFPDMVTDQDCQRATDLHIGQTEDSCHRRLP